jgi:hypothetical protein
LIPLISPADRVNPVLAFNLFWYMKNPCAPWHRAQLVLPVPSSSASSLLECPRPVALRVFHWEKMLCVVRPWHPAHISAL